MTAAQAIVVLNVAALGTLMLSMAFQVSLATALAAARPPSLMIRCLVANYVLVPAIALGLLWAFHAHPLVWIGFFILAVCPGAPVGPPLTALANGNLSLAIAMMILLAGLSTILAPSLLSIFLAWAVPDSNLHVDFLAVVRTLLIAQLAPLALGFVVHQFAPTLTAKLVRPVGLLANVLMLALIVAIIASEYHTLADIKAKGWFGMALLLAASLAVGWWLGGSDRSNRTALAVTTGPRNAAVGLAIATGNFAGTPVVTAVVAYGIASMIGTMVFAMMLSRRQRNH